MGRRNQIILGGAILGLGAALASRGAPPTAEVSELKVTIREWDVPTKGAHPHGPAVGPDGALWFTEQMQNKIGSVDPKTGAFRDYRLNIGDSGPQGLVADRQGSIWFTGNFKGYIGKLDPRTGTVTEFKIPDAKAADPHTAVFDGQGLLWFTLKVANIVGRLNPRTGKIDLKNAPTANSHPYGIAINSKGVPVFCEFATHKMAKIDPKTMEITEYTLPHRARPRRIAIDANDRVSFTNFGEGHLGRLELTSGVVKMWPSPGGAQPAPYGIAITPDGMFWYGESGMKPNTIIQFDPKTETLRVPSSPPAAKQYAIWPPLPTGGCILLAAA